ncbi:NQR2, RnfD, RnfE family [Saccharopolyspora antimicrobica]|uniref:NQR2, RnfD, RnfE family n=1 Tax=Saccharopolyspora antimicrobica TaxID=455193 RepID=A0A1I4VSU7_9PSEU|nr:RnfABCDGE type electron transport complex subunit D [Saccharopolyspora antimicrobica]RKT87222.1 NQR2/RnfD/RnfE family subunit of NADH-ubiquinone oxidoreductase [Saccharopolyspora antimicrobica]SFN04364.1 NQR2, RnfD, RnfE family [Saccharopolyspora antimicrobica]
MADNTTSTAAPPRHDQKVTKALRNFAISITVFNIIGYALLGFEQPWTWPFIALATGYITEIVLEVIGARVEGRAPRFTGRGVRGIVEFLYPAHITSLAMNMLIYVNDRLWVLIFGVVVAVGTKWVLRAPVRGRMRHFMNPSNWGITVLLLLFPWMSIAPPYHFSEHVEGWVDWLIPAIIVIAGTILNGKLTGRLWLIGAWLVTFVLQAVVRGIIFDTSIPAGLAMMTGIAFVLYTNYMVTDPGTTPSKPASQIAFGSGVAIIYGLLMVAHIAYGLFLATAIVCLIRGLFLWSLHFSNKAREEFEAEQAAVAGTNGGGAAPVALGPTVQPALGDSSEDNRILRS